MPSQPRSPLLLRPVRIPPPFFQVFIYSKFPSSTPGSIEVGDYSLCHHGIEACELCHVDFREDNTFVAGLEPGSTERASVKVDYALDKEGNIVCKQHRSATCGNCLNIKCVAFRPSFLRPPCFPFACFLSLFFISFFPFVALRN